MTEAMETSYTNCFVRVYNFNCMHLSLYCSDNHPGFQESHSELSSQSTYSKTLLSSFLSSLITYLRIYHPGSLL